MVDHKPEALESAQKPITMNTFLLGLIGKRGYTVHHTTASNATTTNEEVLERRSK